MYDDFNLDLCLLGEPLNFDIGKPSQFKSQTRQLRA